MRTTTLLLATLKESPANAEIISHQLMLRAGLIRKIASGLYTWLPMGLRVLRKVENIIREEMTQAGAQEILMPAIQPATLWQTSGRWNHYGPELLRLKDRHQREFCLGPTHEEVITTLAAKEIKSYRQLPQNFFQIQTKFRDEIRPRFGLMRAREFIMKDAYSFHIDEASLQETYEKMYQTYERIFQRFGLEFRAVEAATGSIGGNTSHEFHVLAESGEDAIAFSNVSDYAANVELAPTVPVKQQKISNDNLPESTLERIETPDVDNIPSVAKFLGINSDQCIKTLLIKGSDETIIALLIRGDHELNFTKLEQLETVSTPVEFANAEQIRKTANCDAGFIGPLNLKCKIIADYSVADLKDFVCGANENDFHCRNVNWGIDLALPELADIRNIMDGDVSPDGNGEIVIKRGIEVGHIFQLGKKYSKAMGADCLNDQGKAVTMSMGCYGIGVSRVVAATIEQNNDKRGIIWPESLAPFQLLLVPMNLHKSARLREAAEDLYQSLLKAGFEVLFEDRKERAGVLFANADLIGIPHRLVLGERGLDNGEIEYKHRTDENPTLLKLNNLIPILQEKLSGPSI